MSEKLPNEGPAEMMSKALNKMKAGKAAGPPGIIEIIKLANNKIFDDITSIFNHIVYESRPPND